MSGSTIDNFKSGKLVVKRIKSVHSLCTGQTVIRIAPAPRERKLLVQWHYVEDIITDLALLSHPSHEVFMADLDISDQGTCRNVVFALEPPCEDVVADRQVLPYQEISLVPSSEHIQVGENVIVFSKVIDPNDPTALLIKQLEGVATDSSEGVVTFGDYSVRDAHIDLAQAETDHHRRPAGFFADVVCCKLLSTISPPTSPAALGTQQEQQEAL